MQFGIKDRLLYETINQQKSEIMNAQLKYRVKEENTLKEMDNERKIRMLKLHKDRSEGIKINIVR
jgi:hypothetical protein